jgi:23S rRNA pseudouridine2605 synthase
MRINKYLAQATGMSRRAADGIIDEGRVHINGTVAKAGSSVTETDSVMLDGKPAHLKQTRTIMLNKPVGYVVSRDGQGSKTIYDLLPDNFHDLKPVGRLDKDSSGLLILTNNGTLANDLTHPSKQKVKVYEIVLDQPLQPLHRQMISDYGVALEDGPSKLQLERLKEGDDRAWRVSMHEGRNRQIRRTFAALGYSVEKLHRTHFGPYVLSDLRIGFYTDISHIF